MRILLFIFLLLTSFFCQAQLNPQSKKVTEKFFPDFDIEINTPAFSKKKGFTNYEEMMGYVNTLVRDHPSVMTLSFIGSSQKGKEIPLLRLSHPNAEGEKVKVWIQGGLHGNEPASTEGVLFLIDRLLNDSSYSYLLDRIDLAVVPMANIDGYEKQDRYAANGLDLNRDQTKLQAPESIALKKAFSEFGAEVAMDFHEYRPYRKDFAQLSTYGITSRFDAMFLYSGNLNVPQNLRNFTQQVFVKNATQALDAEGLSNHDYVSTIRHRGEIHFNKGSNNARSSATSYALTNAVSCLFEIRGVGIGRTSFTRRVYTTFLIGTSFLKTAYENVPRVKSEIRQAGLAAEEAVVQSKKDVSEQPLQVIDLDKNEEITLTVTVRDAWISSPELTRVRPTAYLILPEQTEIAEKLSILGLKTERLPAETDIEVERYVVETYQRDPEKYEGVNQQEVTTQTSTLNKTFPEGTYVLYLDQPKANIAIEVLEPEAPNSFVTFDLLKTAEGEELPIYRYLKSSRL